MFRSKLPSEEEKKRERKETDFVETNKKESSTPDKWILRDFLVKMRLNGYFFRHIS